MTNFDVKRLAFKGAKAIRFRWVTKFKKYKSCLTPQNGQRVRKLIERPCFEATFFTRHMHHK